MATLVAPSLGNTRPHQCHGPIRGALHGQLRGPLHYDGLATFRVASDCCAISGDRHHGLPRPDPLVVVGNMRRCQELEDAMVPSVVQVDNLNLRFKF